MMLAFQRDNVSNAIRANSSTKQIPGTVKLKENQENVNLLLFHSVKQQKEIQYELYFGRQ